MQSQKSLGMREMQTAKSLRSIGEGIRKEKSVQFAQPQQAPPPPVPANSVGVSCPSGHPCGVMMANNLIAGHSCSSCPRQIKLGVPVVLCAPCGYCVCPFCLKGVGLTMVDLQNAIKAGKAGAAAPPPPAIGKSSPRGKNSVHSRNDAPAPAARQPSTKSMASTFTRGCEDGHHLIFYEPDVDTSCKRCGNLIRAGDKVKGCLNCTFDLCLNCLADPSVEAGLTSESTMARTQSQSSTQSAGHYDWNGFEQAPAEDENPGFGIPPNSHLAPMEAHRRWQMGLVDDGLTKTSRPSYRKTMSRYSQGSLETSPGGGQWHDIWTTLEDVARRPSVADVGLVRPAGLDRLCTKPNLEDDDHVYTPSTHRKPAGGQQSPRGQPRGPVGGPPRPASVKSLSKDPRGLGYEKARSASPNPGVAFGSPLGVKSASHSPRPTSDWGSPNPPRTTAPPMGMNSDGKERWRHLSHQRQAWQWAGSAPDMRRAQSERIPTQSHGVQPYGHGRGGAPAAGSPRRRPEHSAVSLGVGSTSASRNTEKLEIGGRARSCARCGVAYTGFGNTCSNCRSGRANITRCVNCYSYFNGNGYDQQCQECRGGSPSEMF